MINTDFHLHTLWSDGRQSIKENLDACTVAGLEKAAITDHFTKGSSMRLDHYITEIEKVSRNYPFKVFKGLELQLTDDLLLDYFSLEQKNKIDFTLCELPGSFIFGNFETAKWAEERKDISVFLKTVMKACQRIAESPFADVIAHPFNFGRMKLSFDYQLKHFSKKSLDDLADTMCRNHKSKNTDSIRPPGSKLTSFHCPLFIFSSRLFIP